MASILQRVDEHGRDHQPTGSALAAAAAAAALATAALATAALESAAGGDEEPAPPFERLDDVPTLRDFTASKRPIGAGGFGKVHCCCHTPSGRHFALKHMEKVQAVKLNAAAAVLSESEP